MRISTIVIGVDGREGGRDAIAVARMIAPAARLVLVGVWDADLERFGPLQPGPGPVWEERVIAERERAQVAADVRTLSARSVSRGLHEMAEAARADVIAIGTTRREGIGRLVLGDDARATLHGAPCGVVIAPAGWAADRRGLRRIAVGWDGSPEADEALAAARAIAAGTDTSIEVVTAVPHFLPPVDAGSAWVPGLTVDELAAIQRDAVERAARRLADLPDVEGHAEAGAPADRLREAAGRADLLVVGSRGHGPLRRLLTGSTADALAGTTSCPLLVVPRPARPNARPVDVAAATA